MKLKFFQTGSKLKVPVIQEMTMLKVFKPDKTFKVSRT